MARRQGLLFQNVPSYLDKLLYQQRTTTAGVGAYRPGQNTKTKAGKSSGLSNVAATTSVANSAYKLYDRMKGGPGDGLVDKALDAAKGLFNPTTEAVGPTVEAAKSVTGEAAKEVLSAASSPVAESLVAGEKGLETALATKPAEASVGAETMAAMSEAWGAVAGGAQSAYSWLLALL